MSFKDLHAQFSKDLNISQSFIKKHINDAEFCEKLKAIIDKKNFSCSAVFDLTYKMINELSKADLPFDWLNYIYQFALYKSFPDAVTIKLDERLNVACNLYLNALRIISRYQMENKDGTWQSKYPMVFLTKNEIEYLESPKEYLSFMNAFARDYIYEMMKLSKEVMGYSTLDHICGVHHLALTLGRQLKKKGIPVDLGRVSGAAAGHDIGKYGCKGVELIRVPYLHYYYTDQWFKKFDINYISHIAVNHSTWDLELENLPLESLLLIYADFRVKRKNSENGSSTMHFYSLKDSFDVILSKLDNVDENKLKRYQKIYAKLEDFENYMLRQNISLDPDFEYDNTDSIYKPSAYSLMQGKEIVDSLKFLAIDHNINLMHQFRDEFSLSMILQSARSLTDWKSLREYIRIFEEYSAYLTQKQKIQTLKFLFEFATHPEEDIRRRTAEIIGSLIAMYDEDYRKEIPGDVSIQRGDITSRSIFEEYLNLFLYPGHRYIDEYKEWIGINLSAMVSSVFEHCPKRLVNELMNTLLKFYEYYDSKSKASLLYLLKTAEHIPLDYCDINFNPVFLFLIKVLNKERGTLKLAGYESAYNLMLRINEPCSLHTGLTELIESHASRSKYPTENYMKLKIARHLEMKDEIIAELEQNCRLDNKEQSEMFLSNLKTATNWIIKKTQIEILLEQALKNPKGDGLHTAIHLCNLLKVSAMEYVRTNAGEAIVKIMPGLSPDKRNEVAVELVRALEIEGYHFTEYIPNYLGQVMLWLQPVELDELIDDLAVKIKRSDSQIKSLILKTIGVCIEHYPKYSSTFFEDINKFHDRLKKMLGILLNALGDYNIHVKQIAFSVFCKDIFGSEHLNTEEKAHIFTLTAKKILVLLVDNKKDQLLFLTNSAGLNHIYRFVSDYILSIGDLVLKTPEKIAFFPGTFDPFSLSHKEIVKRVADLGFEVYLSIDEFSWSKRTLPNLLRRRIASISTADEPRVYLYPENFTANIANPDDLKVLKENFGKSEVYMAVGSDVVLNASCYEGEKASDSIYSFPHIIIDRNDNTDKNKKIGDIIKNIEGECLWLTLPKEYSEISSTHIRKHIDENRDISNFVDSLAERYIFEHGFYQREPQEKSLLQSSIDRKIEIYESIKPEIIYKLAALNPEEYDRIKKALLELSANTSYRIITLYDSPNGNILGCSIFHWVPSSNLYSEFKNDALSKYVRNNTIGRIVLIDGIIVDEKMKGKALEQVLVTETLAFCLAGDYQSAVYYDSIHEKCPPKVMEILTLQGFIKLDIPDNDNPAFVVDMSNPSIIDLDIETVLKEPFKSNSVIMKAISKTRKKLQKAMTKLYPGQLILSFDINVQHELMIKKICQENNVPTHIEEPKNLGPFMCVPYGNILDKYIIPNTVTKALHTEKLFYPDMKTFTIGPYPYYLDLDIQAKAIHSFKRKVILVDDLLHKGHRVKAVDAVFKKEDVFVHKIIVGILSGRGKELMDMQHREVDSVYFIPKLNIWFNENALYPFIGGDALWRGVYPERNLLPSINYILPYTSPTFIKDADNSSIFNLSRTAIENAIDILSALENEYHVLNEKNLTLSRLGEVFIAPRCPDKGQNMDYDLNFSPSYYLKNDLELLIRLQDIIARI
ncbi:phosphopantetheine adenylyltransferase [Oxobacter pfennigii]|uniref:nicotinate-nucleotide adenylyltransferase n=1 Tax=Oxobacter pfennigii TaxID=36849 RepID=A0A0P9AKQ0_9CLOT|nr:cytidyltransferase [Oxobacter pfennigii]KPU45921.1 phosphopantetheine adenylyltransferase [Oxobacter pfennigii]